MAPGPIFSVLQNLPHVVNLNLRLDDNEKLNLVLRKQLRSEFAQALTCQRSAVLTELDIVYLHQSPGDHRTMNFDVRETIDGSTFDPLSLGLNRFISSCGALAEVSLDGPICVDETLFWPPSAVDGPELLANIKDYVVNLCGVRPDGGWYLEEHSGFPRDEPCRQWGMDFDPDDDSLDSETTSISDTDEPDTAEAEDLLPPDSYNEHKQGLQIGDAYNLSFRTQPTEQLERIWLATARASACMPNLEFMCVGIRIESCPRTESQLQDFDLTYYAKGRRLCNSHVLAPVPQLHWNAPIEWEMSGELEALWRKVLGPMGIVEYGHW